MSSFCEAARGILGNHSAYHLLADSGKVVVFDSELPVKFAFFALVEHDIKCAPIWNSELGDYSGMITVTDFIDILVKYYDEKTPQSTSFIDDIGGRTCQQWTSTDARMSSLIPV